MNEQLVISVAQAIISSNEVLKALIETLSADTKAAVEAKVGKKQKDTPVAAPVATPEPAAAAAPAPMPAAPFPTTPYTNPATVSAPVVAAPVVPTQAPAPIPVAPVMAAPAPVAPAPVSASPFNDPSSLMTWVTTKYKEMGPQKGARIQECLNQIGAQAIGDVKPEQYANFAQLVLNLQASA